MESTEKHKQMTDFSGVFKYYLLISHFDRQIELFCSYFHFGEDYDWTKHLRSEKLMSFSILLILSAVIAVVSKGGGGF